MNLGAYLRSSNRSVYLFFSGIDPDNVAVAGSIVALDLDYGLGADDGAHCAAGAVNLHPLGGEVPIPV